MIRLATAVAALACAAAALPAWPQAPQRPQIETRKGTLRLGGTALELSYVGLNHSDSTLVMRLPKERLIFVVDLIPVGTVPGRGMIGFHPLEAEESIKRILAMDWDRMIPGRLGQNAPERQGAKRPDRRGATCRSPARETSEIDFPIAPATTLRQAQPRAIASSRSSAKPSNRSILRRPSVDG
jgi:hypothetical protein